jgi:predicted RNA-binding protein
MSKEKKIAQGGTLLIPREEWGDASTIQGNDLDVLYSPIMERAFKRIVELHTPKHQIAFCSLCTVTRPYSTGRKWKTLKQHYSTMCDLIINSNGGVIPIEFERQYPYMTYDAHGRKEFDKQYIEVLTARLKTFFSKHRYRYIMFNFRPNLRNVHTAENAGKWLVENEFIEDYKILPTKEHYQQSQREDFHKKGYAMFPELYPTMFMPVYKQIKAWNKTIKESQNAAS